MLVVGVKDIIQYGAVFSSKLQPKEILVQEERHENALMMQIENIRHNFLQRRDQMSSCHRLLHQLKIPFSHLTNMHTAQLKF